MSNKLLVSGIVCLHRLFLAGYHSSAYRSQIFDCVLPIAELPTRSSAINTSLTSPLVPSNNGIDLQTPLLNHLESCTDITVEEKNTLYVVLEELANDLEHVSLVGQATLANQRIKQLVKSILPVGMTSGTLFLVADRFYAKQRKLNTNKVVFKEDEHLRLACVLCWIIEMYMRNLILQDDIMDGNTVRNNVSCWHMADNTGLQAIKDSQVLRNACFILLKKYFKNKDYYIELVDFLNDCMYGTDIGLTQMDIIKPALNTNIPQPIEQLIAGKMYGYGSFFPYGAVVAAMIINNIKVPAIMSSLHEIAFKTAIIASISEDYIDCYGDARINERDTTDISQGKQTWLYWKALELGSASQGKELQRSYGKPDQVCVDAVKSIYEDLSIKENTNKWLQYMAENVNAAISRLPQENVPWKVFLDLIKYCEGVRSGKYIRP